MSKITNEEFLKKFNEFLNNKTYDDETLCKGDKCIMRDECKRYKNFISKKHGWIFTESPFVIDENGNFKCDFK